LLRCTHEIGLRQQKTEKAVAYIRTSSSTNVGEDKDSEARQRADIEACAKRFGFGVVEWFSDPGVKGGRTDLGVMPDPIETRPGFGALLDRIEGNGVRVVLVEDISRFARDVLTQEIGIVTLIARKVRLFDRSGENLTDTTDPMKIAMRQIAGAFAQLEKARLVNKLRVARERKRERTGKCEGQKSMLERAPEVVKAAKTIRDDHPHSSLREVSAGLQALGFVSCSGKPYAPKVVRDMLTVSWTAVHRALQAEEARRPN
jgi:DNA invertase Pin-like site-specific DNA recombinase